MAASGRRGALRRLPLQRFGDLPEALEQRIAGADEATLDALLDQAVTAPTIEEL